MLKEKLKEYDQNQVELYEKYVNSLKTEKTKDGKIKNYWATQKTDDFFIDCFKKIQTTGLSFDGKHITVNRNGVSYDYVAYKNKMLLAYPESQLDVALVYNGDDFSVRKENGKVEYKHNINSPFSHKDSDIIGGYMVVKNKRGEFFTSLSLEEINKCKSVAKTDDIWKQWFAEMAMKTVIKKAVKLHFDDIFAEMEDEDNKNYDLEKTQEPKQDKTLELFKELVKGATFEKELIEKFEELDIAGRRKMYKEVLEQKKGAKNDNS